VVSGFFTEDAMERLLTMDKQQFVERMQAEIRQTMEQVADAVNNAPSGNVISGSEMAVRDLMADLRQRVFQTAVQMRIDSTESSFSPSQGCGGTAQGQEWPSQPQHAERQRADRPVPPAVHRRRRGG
jgi:hypothetical protein